MFPDKTPLYLHLPRCEPCSEVPSLDPMVGTRIFADSCAAAGWDYCDNSWMRALVVEEVEAPHSPSRSCAWIRSDGRPSSGCCCYSCCCSCCRHCYMRSCSSAFDFWPKQNVISILKCKRKENYLLSCWGSRKNP